jgi:hypothetical protein|tara:strand:- start:3065 stop:3340 length:276 start_codon:yes stop_codon:yes gene_type:complete
MNSEYLDYDQNGNSIVPCPICLNVYCRSNRAGTLDKCPEEDEFVKCIEEAETFDTRTEFKKEAQGKNSFEFDPIKHLEIIETYNNNKHESN